MESVEQDVGRDGFVELEPDTGEKVDNGTKVKDLALVALEIAEVVKFGFEGLGDVFVFADLLFIHRKDGVVLAACRAGQRHGLKLLAVHRQQ